MSLKNPKTFKKMLRKSPDSDAYAERLFFLELFKSYKTD